MALLVLEEPRLSRQRCIIASTANREAITTFWRSVLAEADATVIDLESHGDEIMAAVERAERDRLRRVAALFGGGCVSNDH
jgi:hypothetical protein